MTTTTEATFDGTVFRPIGPVPLAANTAVRLTIEPLGPKSAMPASFLRTARALDFKGPPDWANT